MPKINEKMQPNVSVEDRDWQPYTANETAYQYGECPNCGQQADCVAEWGKPAGSRFEYDEFECDCGVHFTQQLLFNDDDSWCYRFWRIETD